MPTKVISDAGPTEREAKHDVALAAWCRTRIEPTEESQRRRGVLEFLSSVVKAWIRATYVTQYRVAPETVEAQVEGRLFTTGSYRYNVHTSGSDIDVVLIAPSRITREQFFSTLVERLRTQGEGRITQLDPVTDANVPIIAMRIDGVDIDLSFGAISRDRVPEVITDDCLVGLDEAATRSCNAVRVAHAVIDLVPNKGTFRQALRFVKAWGKARGIYSAKFGYPSGIGWAILVAFACQCYPNKNAAGLVACFFRLYSSWFKPEAGEPGGAPNRAIYLTDTIKPRVDLGRCWDPSTSKSDARALFPVLTPANPYQNSCYNVSVTTLRVLCAEFRRGHDILQRALASDPPPAADASDYGVWRELLEPYPFFTAHRRYLHVSAAVAATPAGAECYRRYADAVEAKIRFLWTDRAETAGSALECIKTVRVRVFADHYEADEEKRLLGAMTAKGVTPAAAAALAAAATYADGRKIESFTAHFFFGLDISAATTSATGAAPQPAANLTPAVRAFLKLIEGLKEFKPGVTKLPTVAVVDASKIPEWVTGGVSAKLPPAPAAAPAAAAEVPPPPPAAPQEAAVAAGGDSARKRERENDGGSEGAVAAATTTAPPSVSATAPPTAAPASSVAAAVDSALGMDF